MSTACSRKKLCGLLTTREAEVLGPLLANREKYAIPPSDASRQPGWCRCRDIGGTRDSHHSLTVRRLVDKGLVESLPLSSQRALAKPLLVYRATEAGQKLWEEYLAYLEHARIAHPKANRTPEGARFEVTTQSSMP